MSAINVDAKTELIDKLSMWMFSKGIDTNESRGKLTLMLADYDISIAERSLVVYQEGKNKYFIDRWLVSKTVAGCSPRTINYYQKTATHIFEAIGKNADEVEAIDIQVYLARKKALTNCSNTTLSNETHVLGSLYEYLLREEMVTKNPMLRVDVVKKEKKIETVFSDMEIEEMRNHYANNKERAIIEIMLSTGCRVSEVVSIKIADIESDKIYILGKGNKYRWVYLNAKAQIAIRDYIAERSDENPYLFPAMIQAAELVKKNPTIRKKEYHSLYKDPENIKPEGAMNKSSVEQLVRRLSKRAGVEGAHPHRFRKTCATHALRKGMPIELVSKMLGHANIATTQIYLDITEDELEQAHRKYV